MLSSRLRFLVYALLMACFDLALVPPMAVGQKAAPEEIDRRVDALLSQLSLEQKIELIGGVDGMYTHAMPAIKLPRLKMSDGPMGVRTWGPTTGYAAGIGLAASWDRDLARSVGEGLGQDAKARGVNILLGPGVNIYRSPTNGRNFEYFGEDPYLASRIAVAYIQGVQSQGVIATVKHYAVNNSEYDRNNINSIVDERTLREIYLPVFEAAVKEAHVGAVMDSYNLINGEHATQNTFLNLTALKKDWGFKGILMSDWGATYDGVAAANNGLDLEMPSGVWMNQQTLQSAIQAGKVSMDTIDDKVRRILRAAIEYGFIDHEQTDLDVPLYNLQSRQTALQSAEESIVLLKNDRHLLPLNPTQIHTIAVIGPDAYPALPTAGGSGQVTAFAPVSVMTGLSDALGTGSKVLWNRGVKDLRNIFDGTGSMPYGNDKGGARLFTDPEGKHPGLNQEEFEGVGVTGNPIHVGTVPRINFWNSSPSSDQGERKHSFRWTAYYIPKVSGPQRFITAGVAGDTYELYVDNQLLIEQPRREGQAPQAKDLDLPAGKPVAVRFEFISNTDGLNAGLGVIPSSEMIEPEAIKMAAKADVVLVSLGFDPVTEGEGLDRTYTLPPGQDELIRAVFAANKNVIVTITAGGSVDTSQWVDGTSTLLQTWYGGQEAGRALAKVLLGEVNPAGKLPMTWERRIEDNPTHASYYPAPGSKDVTYKEGIFVGYRGYEHLNVKPLFPFGFGLSYTTFGFGNLSVNPATAKADAPITVNFDITNLGHQAGADVAQVYVGDPSASVARPVKELKGFERVVLKPGETRRISLQLNRRSLAYWDVNSESWKVDPGQFRVFVGDSSAAVPLQKDFTVQ